jgi:hypothetical protein
MAYAHSAVAPRSIEFKDESPRAQKRSALRRLLDAIEDSNRLRAEREIARYLGGAGAKFTDESAREIAPRFLTNANW